MSGLITNVASVPPHLNVLTGLFFHIRQKGKIALEIAFSNVLQHWVKIKLQMARERRSKNVKYDFVSSAHGHDL
jgi:hypothetical protein